MTKACGQILYHAVKIFHSFYDNLPCPFCQNLCLVDHLHKLWRPLVGSAAMKLSFHNSIVAYCPDWPFVPARFPLQIFPGSQWASAPNIFRRAQPACPRRPFVSGRRCSRHGKLPVRTMSPHHQPRRPWSGLTANIPPLHVRVAPLPRTRTPQDRPRQAIAA